MTTSLNPTELYIKMISLLSLHRMNH